MKAVIKMHDPSLAPSTDVGDLERVVFKAPTVTVSGVKFPRGGISDKADVTAYNTTDLKRVATDLIRRATPQEADALRRLFTKYAEMATEAEAA
jgi:hypothetical protein